MNVTRLCGGKTKLFTEPHLLFIFSRVLLTNIRNDEEELFAVHALRLFTIKMAQRQSNGSPGPVSTVAVIGAGPSGLAAARRLKNACLNVTVFERKSKAGGTWLETHMSTD